MYVGNTAQVIPHLHGPATAEVDGDRCCSCKALQCSPVFHWLEGYYNLPVRTNLWSYIDYCNIPRCIIRSSQLKQSRSWNLCLSYSPANRTSIALPNAGVSGDRFAVLTARLMQPCVPLERYYYDLSVGTNVGSWVGCVSCVVTS